MVLSTYYTYLHVTIATAKRIIIGQDLITISGIIPRPGVLSGFISEVLSSITRCFILGNINCY
jgi:hypothetical protein